MPSDKPHNFQDILNRVRSQTGINQIRGITVKNATGAGIPKHVTALQVSLSNAQTGSTTTVTLSFQRDPADTAFSGATVWVRGYQNNNQPVQIASGTDSPVTFILNNTGESCTFIVQAQGNGGAAPISSAPTAGVTLPKSSAGGVGTTTSTGASVSGTVGSLAKITSASAVASTDLTGDVTTSGTPASTVVKIQGTPVLSRAPITGDSLVFDGTNWTPTTGFEQLIKQWSTTAGAISGSNFACNMSFSGTNSVVEASATDGPYAQLATASTATQGAAYCDGSTGTSGLHVTQFSWRWLRSRILLPQTTHTRCWVGFSGQATAANVITNLSADDPTTQNVVAFRYSANANDTNWQAYCADGSASHIVDTGVPPNTSVSQSMRIVNNPAAGAVYFFIDDALVATISAHIPAAATLMSHCLEVDNCGNAVSVNVRAMGFRVGAYL